VIFLIFTPQLKHKIIKRFKQIEIFNSFTIFINLGRVFGIYK